MEHLRRRRSLYCEYLQDRVDAQDWHGVMDAAADLREIDAALRERAMPSKSAKQHRFMEAVAHNPKFAKKVGVPQSVGKEFAAADKVKRKNRKNAG